MMKTANFIYSAAQLGHRELSMTQRYAHLSPDHMRAVADLTKAEVGSRPAIREAVGSDLRPLHPAGLHKYCNFAV